MVLPILLLIISVALNEPVAVSASKHSKRDFFKLDEDKVKFYLWNNHTVEQEIRLNEYGNITNAPTKFLIHGWFDSGTGSGFFFYGPMVQKYIKTGANVICVDWSYYSKSEYVNSVLWLRPIADLLARMIIGLKEKSLPLSNVHLIGHSLGAQISGFTGKYIQERTNGQKIDRISGIDPAGPLFADRPLTDRLNKTDATKVDTVIADTVQHQQEAEGQVNFYIYCGANIKTIPLNHNLAPFYYEYGILRNDLIGKVCECKFQQMQDCKTEPTNVLGENTDFKKPGTYYLNINIKEMMEDAKNAMKDAPKTRIKIEFNIVKDLINAWYITQTAKSKKL